MMDEKLMWERRNIKPEDWGTRFEDFRFMTELINFEEQEILNAGLTPCSHTTTTTVFRSMSLLLRCTSDYIKCESELISGLCLEFSGLFFLNTLPGVSTQKNS